MAQKKKFVIYAGPSKGEMGNALIFKANREDIYLEFRVKDPDNKNGWWSPVDINLTMLKLDYGDTERENFFFEGKTLSGSPTHGFFSTKVRKGWLEIEI
ncbi:MAG: hypothetical protein G01um101419_310 [Parcubacteria group bacterium Gr01-1014_19]|nr:MAG: hypothetical protein G01um101419_310 [Parcubacteria group bacterium Gr01-1014_19]